MKIEVIIVSICFIVLAGIVAIEIPITKQIPYQDEETYYIDVPYQKAINKIVTHDEPIYTKIVHEDPVYETLQNIELRDESVWGDEVYRRNNVYKVDRTYTGNDAWGNSEYTYKLFYYTTIPDGTKTYSTFYQIDDWDTTSFEAIVRYNSWSENVISDYDTWTEEVVDYYVTANRQETRYREVTKYKTVTKTVYEWYLS